MNMMYFTIEGLMEKKADNYIASIQEHVKDCIYNLEDFSRRQGSSKFTAKDYYAIERLLQVLIEAGIGLAKQLVKSQKMPIQAKAYENFVKLCDLKIISEVELQKWKGIIGLRNILVHDYLNIDREILRTILKKKEYRLIEEFIKKSVSKLKT